MANTATRCDDCGKPLTANRYTVNPRTGQQCKKRAWCVACSERLVAQAAREMTWYKPEPDIERKEEDE